MGPSSRGATLLGARLCTRRLLATCCVTSTLALTTPAAALEPLETFLTSARTRSFDTREARTILNQRRSDHQQALFELLPTLTATAGYQYNQVEVVTQFPDGPTTSRRAVLTPHHQRDATLSAELPIIDVATWARMGSTHDTEDAARAEVSARELDAQRAAARAYYAVVATEAVIVAAQRSLEVAHKNRELSVARFQTGVAAEIDVKRADAEVERNRQLRADATYQAAIARRDLETVSGLTPSPGAPVLDASLAPEQALSTFQRSRESQPLVRAARKDADAAEAVHRAARAALLPTVKATFNERFTNATGFGPSKYFNVGISASIKLDPILPAAAKGQGYAVEVARIRAARAQREVDDAIYGAWLDVTRQIEKARATRAQLDASRLAAGLARDRYEAGTATFLDLVVAERDVLSAEVERIRADSDLQHARVALRLYAGENPKGAARP